MMTTNPSVGDTVSSEVFVALGLGANLGSPVASIRRAAERLGVAGVRGLRLSGFYRTAPVGCVPGTPPFVNAAAAGLWAGTPAALLRACAAIEVTLGRPAVHSSRESRAIDIDILLFGEEEIRQPDLVVPHPRLAERMFVLAPLAELAGERVVPGTGQTVAALYAALASRGSGEAWGTRILPEDAGDCR